MSTFSNLRDANVARQAEWAGEVKLSLAYKGNELAGEVGEACNVIKKLDRELLGIAGSRDTREHLAEELADVIICVDLIAIEAECEPIEARRMSNIRLISLSAGGNRLGAGVGSVCQAIDDGDLEWLWDALRDLVTTAEMIARAAEIDLDVAVRAKFNATSEKVGLKTRLAA